MKFAIKKEILDKWQVDPSHHPHPLTCYLRPALEEGGEFVGGAEVPVARLALVDRAIGDVVGVLDQAEVAGPTVLQGGRRNYIFASFCLVFADKFSPLKDFYR